jgi:hypothetical protein
LAVLDATSVPWHALALAILAALLTALAGALALAWKPSRKAAGAFLRAP